MTDRLDAGAFGAWLEVIGPALRGEAESDVPCGSCTACCRSSQFVLVAADEHEARRAIPAELLFPAPFLAGAHVLPYDDRGRCPMLGERGCTVYAERPMTCRTYDCRVLAAAGLEPDKPAIAEQVRRWEFDLATDDDVRARDAVHAAAWLQQHAEVLPEDVRPPHVTAVAVLAVQLHALWLADTEPTDAVIVAAAREARSR